MNFDYRSMEDFVTWVRWLMTTILIELASPFAHRPLQVDTSKLKRTVKTYNDELDDFDLMTS